MNPRIHLFAIPCLTTIALAQSATYSTFGTGCNATPAVVPYALNETAPTLRVASLPNEYAYPVINTATTPVQVTGFEIYTRSNSGTTHETGFARILADSSGAGATAHTSPDATSLAVGVIEVGPTADWYSVAVVPAVVVQPGEAFWIGVDAFSRIAPPQNQGGSPAVATIHYRRPNLNNNTWTPSVSVTNPIVRLAGYAPTPVVPTLSASAPPVLGQNLVINVDGTQPGIPVFLAFALSDQTWLGLPLPVDLALVGAPSCFAYTSNDTNQILVSGPTGTATLTLAIPASPTLAGFAFFNQAAIPGAVNNLGFYVTNAGKGTVGN